MFYIFCWTIISILDSQQLQLVGKAHGNAKLDKTIILTILGLPIEADLGGDVNAYGQLLIGNSNGVQLVKRQGDITLTGTSGSSTLNGIGGNIQIIEKGGKLQLARVSAD